MHHKKVTLNPLQFQYASYEMRITCITLAEKEPSPLRWRGGWGRFTHGRTVRPTCCGKLMFTCRVTLLDAMDATRTGARRLEFGTLCGQFTRRTVIGWIEGVPLALGKSPASFSALS